MDKKQIASILDEMGIFFELKGENPFKCRAFHNAARIVESLTEDVASLVSSGGILEVKGIGEHLAGVVSELVTNGSSSEYAKVKSSLPAGLLQMVRIPGLGPKRIKILYEKLKVTSIEELAEACRIHRLAALEGFGEKTEENILQGIELLAKSSDKHLYPHARGAADPILASISQLKEVKRCEVAGSLRRRKEVIGDIDIVVSAAGKDRKEIFDVFLNHPDVQSIIARGETKSSVTLKSGMNCDLRIVEDTEYPFALNYFTGSKEHNVEMRSRARKYGLSLNEYAFTRIEDERGKKKKAAVPRCKSEEEIYQALDLSYVPPSSGRTWGRWKRRGKVSCRGFLRKGTFEVHSIATRPIAMD